MGGGAARRFGLFAERGHRNETADAIGEGRMEREKKIDLHCCKRAMLPFQLGNSLPAEHHLTGEVQIR